MGDVAISYSSAQREEAEEIKAALRDAGLTVWVDDQLGRGEDLTDIAIAVGQAHWQIISAALDDALVILVLDSPEWRRSNYCWREYRHAVARGKRVTRLEVAPTGGEEGPDPTWPIADLADLIARFDDGIDVVRAHDRLLRAALEAERTANGRMGPLRSAVRDVNTLVNAGDEVGVRPTGELTEFAERVTRTARRRRAALSSTGSMVVAVALVLAAVAVIAREASIDARKRSQTTAAIQASLGLAQRSSEAETTPERLIAASRSLEARRTPEAIAADRTARSEAAGVRHLRIDSTSTIALGLSDDASRVVVLSGSRYKPTSIALVDSVSGAQSPTVTVDASGLPWMTRIAADASWAVFADRRLDTLSAVTLATGQVRRIVGGFTAFTVDGRGRLVYSTLAGELRRIEDVQGEGPATPLTTIVGHVTGLVTDADGSRLWALLADGTLVELRDNGSGHAEVRRTPMFDPRLTGFGADDAPPLAQGAPDQLVRCGDAVLAFRRGSSAIAGTGATAPPPFQERALLSKVDALRSTGCVGDAAVAAVIGPSPEVTPSSAPVPSGLLGDDDRPGRYAMASNVTGRHLAVAHPSGQLDIFTLDRQPRATPIGSGYLAIPLRTAIVLLDVDGALSVREGDERTLHRAGTTRPIQQGVRPAVVNDHAVVAVEGGAAIVGASGSLLSMQFDDPLEALALRGSGFVAISAGTLLVCDRLPTVGSPSGPPVELPVGLQPNEKVNDLAVATDGSTAFAATSFGRLVAIEVATGRIRAEQRIGPVLTPSSVVIVPDGPMDRVVTFAGDSVMRELRPTDLSVVRSTSIPGTSRQLVVAPDARSILVSTTQGALFLVDAASLRVTQDLASHQSGSSGFAFDPSGKTVVGTVLRRYAAAGEPSGYRYDDQLVEFRVDDK